MEDKIGTGEIGDDDRALNRISIADFEVVSPEPLEKVIEAMNKLIEKHYKFAMNRKKKAISELLMFG